MLTAVRLSPDRAGDIVDVMADGFFGYPVMRWVADTGGGAEDLPARERRLVNLFVTRRIMRGGPAFGVFNGDQLAGAAIVTLPHEPEPPPEVAVLTDETWWALGEEARLRYEAYASAANLFEPIGPHHHLNMIAVRPAFAGQGFARPLLEAVRAMAEADPGSAGVSLTTEKPRNVELYRHFGFEVLAEAAPCDAFKTWGMFQRIR